jgi:hypothetical protein
MAATSRRDKRAKMRGGPERPRALLPESGGSKFCGVHHREHPVRRCLAVSTLASLLVLAALSCKGATGPEGPPGTDGTNGTNGMSGYVAVTSSATFDNTSGDPTIPKVYTAMCPTGKSAVGGGYTTTPVTVFGPDFVAWSNGPIAGDSGWTASFTSAHAFILTVNVTVLCATTS